MIDEQRLFLSMNLITRRCYIISEGLCNSFLLSATRPHFLHTNVGFFTKFTNLSNFSVISSSFHLQSRFIFLSFLAILSALNSISFHPSGLKLFRIRMKIFFTLVCELMSRRLKLRPICIRISYQVGIEIMGVSGYLFPYPIGLMERLIFALQLHFSND